LVYINNQPKINISNYQFFCKNYLEKLGVNQMDFLVKLREIFGSDSVLANTILILHNFIQKPCFILIAKRRFFA